MNYTVNKLAKLSGVTVRTLHYYDALDLLKPAYVGANGYRYYGTDELLRLQQIMFFRELGLSLGEIQRILDDPAFDQVAALVNHRESLERSLRETRRLIETIDNTLAHLKGVTTMADNQLFEGFDPKKQAAYEKELVEDWGVSPQMIDDTKARTAHWGKEKWDEVNQEYDRLHRAFAALCAEQVDVTSQAVQTLVEAHHAVIKRFYTPTAQIYAGLGRMYVEHADFRKLYDGYHPGLAEYMAKAMQVFAAERLE